MRVFKKHGVIASKCLIPYTDFKPFHDAVRHEFTKKQRDTLIKSGRELLDKPYEALNASEYMMYYYNGNRTVYEHVYFERRNTVAALMLAQLASGRDSEEFIQKLIDGVWHILEETSWVLPAHLDSFNGKRNPLPYRYTGEESFVDLFNASTGALLAAVYYFTGSSLNAVSPVICERISHELQRRIIKPFLNNTQMWWTGEGECKNVNNWNPWIVSNVLTVTAYAIEDDALRTRLAARAMKYLDNFTVNYPSDGGCDEGPGYWSVAGGSYFDCLELLGDMSGGKINVYGEPLIQKMGEYIMNVHIDGNCFLPFADAHPHITPPYTMLYRFGMRTGSEKLCAFSAKGIKCTGVISTASTTVYRLLAQYFFDIGKAPAYSAPVSMCMKELEIAAFRESKKTDHGLYIAVKGGNNNESHNHNDIGNFVIYFNGEPLIIDAGVGTYTRNTFINSERYKIWTMQSAYHNLPTVNGIMQQFGREYKADSFIVDEAQQSAHIGLKSAYPDEAGIEAYNRKISLESGRASVCDKITLSVPGEIRFSIMLFNKPLKIGKDYALLAENVRLYFNPELCTELEKIALTDATMLKDWRTDALYRLTLSAKATCGGEYDFTVTHTAE